MDTIEVVTIPVEGNLILETVANTLEAVREKLDGGYVAQIFVSGEPAVLLVDEDGTGKGLPVNPPATRLARSYGLLGGGGGLVGPVVLVGLSRGWWADVPALSVGRLGALGYRLEGL